MLYLFCGDDTKKKVLAYEKFIASAPSTTEKFLIDRRGFDPVQLESFYSGAGLFFSTSLVIFSNLLESAETRDLILKKLDLLSESTNSFVFLENKLTKQILDTFKKNNAHINLHELPKEKKERFNSFLLANAFEAKDKLNLWIYYRQAVDKGVGLEELAGVLFWKIKDMILKKNFRNFSLPQLQNFSSKISYLIPQARKKGHDAEIEFEQFLINCF